MPALINDCCEAYRWNWWSSDTSPTSHCCCRQLCPPLFPRSNILQNIFLFINVWSMAWKKNLKGKWPNLKFNLCEGSNHFHYDYSRRPPRLSKSFLEKFFGFQVTKSSILVWVGYNLICQLPKKKTASKFNTVHPLVAKEEGSHNFLDISIHILLLQHRFLSRFFWNIESNAK